MNRYILDGMVADMRAGKRVLFLGESRTQARKVLDELVPQLLPEEKARRTYGAERVESPEGGKVWLSSVRSDHRGWAIDVVVVEGDPTMSQMQEIAPLLATGGEFIRS